MNSSSTDSIQDWLGRSKSVRQSRIDKLSKFETFIDSKSSTSSQIQSPFLKKYQYAQAQLQQLQMQLDDIRVSSPSASHQKKYQVHLEADEAHVSPINSVTNDESSRNTNNYNKDITNMKKSQSEANMTHNRTNNTSLKRYSQSRSQECLSSLNEAPDTESNPYSMNDIHPTLLANINNTKVYNKMNKSSSSISIRNQLLNANENRIQQQTEVHQSMRRSLIELESASEIQSSSSIRSKSKRKSPRKLSQLSPLKSVLKEEIPQLSPSKSVFVAPCISPKVRANRTLSVSFVQDTNNPIDRVRRSILFQPNDDINDTKSICSPRSPSVHNLRSPKSTKSLLSAIMEPNEEIMSPQTCASSVLSRKSTVYDLVDESERRIVDKQSNIDIYRESVLHQLQHAQSKRDLVLEARQNENTAIQHYKINLQKQILYQWIVYTANEIKYGYEYREKRVKFKCLNQWKRMCSVVNIIRTKKYLNIWRIQNAHHFTRVEKLLQFPTQSRRTFLEIISVLRLSRNSFERTRYKLILKRLYARYKLIIVFVLFFSWRSMAQQRNIAAFNIIKMINEYDTKTKLNALQMWRLRTKRNRLKRKNLLNCATKLHKDYIHKLYFRNWMQLFVYESTVKIALFHWCHKLEHNAFHKWIHCKHWSMDNKLKADKCLKRHLLKRYFTFCIDEFLRIQNERAWKKWREQTKKQQEEKQEQQKEQRQIKREMIANECNKQDSYFTPIQSIEIPQNLFFPYCASSDSQQRVQQNKELDIMNVSNTATSKGTINYIEHCELQSILIPTYDSSMAKKYK